MQAIEVDFDVYKALTLKRRSERETYNDVLRTVLGLPPIVITDQANPRESDGDWVTKGVHFPKGTEFRATYKGRDYHAEVKDGALHLNGKAYNFPSPAAHSITGNSINGWTFWECRLPGQPSFRPMNHMK
jgi:hypothetical protein